MHRSLKLTLLLSVALAGGASAQTDVGGTISVDTTWTKANSPYVLSSSLLVRGGATLTIEPGVEVRFGGNLSMTIGASFGGPASIKSLGTSEEPVIFTSNSEDPGAGDWGFVLVGDLAEDCQTDPVTGDYLGGSIFRHTIIEFGGQGGVATGVVTLVDADVYFDHVTFRDGIRSGVYADFTDDTIGLTFRDCLFERMRSEDGTSDGLGLYLVDGTGHEITRCVFVGCETLDDGAGAYISSTNELRIRDVRFEDCVAADRYGAMFINTCNFVDIDGLEVVGCSAPSFAGVHLAGADNVARNLTFESNMCTSLQGDYAGLFASGSRFTLSDSTFLNNAAGTGNGAEGGGLFLDASTATVTNCTFVGNSAGSTAGGMAIRSAPVTVRDCHFEANRTTFATGTGGGGVQVSIGNIVFEDCTFVGNETATDGGALHGTTASNNLVVRRCLFDTNTSGSEGGAVYLRGDDNTFELCVFVENAAELGGAVFIGPDLMNLTITGDLFTGEYNEFFGNTATVAGSTMYNSLAFQPSGTSNVDASGNCWGTHQAQVVLTLVHDYFDDAGLGIVFVEPVAPCTCPADVNLDGMVSPADFVAWISAYYTGSDLADQNDDGLVTLSDFSAWIINFNAGC